MNNANVSNECVAKVAGSKKTPTGLIACGYFLSGPVVRAKLPDGSGRSRPGR